MAAPASSYFRVGRGRQPAFMESATAQLDVRRLSKSDIFSIRTTIIPKGEMMSMVFCRGCGKEIHSTAPTCPQCGAPQMLNQSSSSSLAIPDGIRGWSWGAFFLNWIWAIGNKTWIGLLCLIPYIGFVMAFILGFKGREWAWKNNDWDSVEHFNRVQKRWSFWGVLICVGVFGIAILAAIAIPAYQD